ncbi:MAG: c-type cytochrome [Chthonomonadales bacterium]
MMNTRVKFLVGSLLASTVLISGLTLTGAAAQGKKKKPVASPAPTKAMLEAGKKLSMENGCTACHMIGDKGGKTAPDLSHLGKDKKWTAAKLVAVIRTPKIALKSDKMPAYGADKINDKDLKSLIAYLQSNK